MVIVFGITGKKFSGKTLVSSYFAKNLISIINLDSYYNDIFLPGTHGYKIILDLLGDKIIKLDGSVDISKLSMYICRDKWVKETVDELMEIEFEKIINKIKNSDNVFNEERLLRKKVLMIDDKTKHNLCGVDFYFTKDTKIYDNFNFIVMVKSRESNRKDRLLKTGFSEELVDKIIIRERGFSIDSKTFTINNNSDISFLQGECDKVIGEIKEYINEEKK